LGYDPRPRILGAALCPGSGIRAPALLAAWRRGRWP